MRLGDFSAKLGREDIFKPTSGDESLQQDSNDNSVRIVNFATSKIWMLRVGCSNAKTFMNKPGPP
jgi:hypothetical protein